MKLKDIRQQQFNNIGSSSAALMAMNTKIANYSLAPHGNNTAYFASSETKNRAVDLLHDPIAIKLPV